MFDWITNKLKLPNIGKTVKVDVFLVHNSRDPEDYFFLFDFELFVETSNSGLFVRPELKVWAGRQDFDRMVFARQFREVFGVEFDRMRQKSTEKSMRGWLNWSGFVGALSPQKISEVLANTVLSMAFGSGRGLFKNTRIERMFHQKSDETKLSAEIDALKSSVEGALQNLEISLHPILYQHAYRGGYKGKVTGMDRDAWPLPKYVTQHLDDKQSGSWW